MEPIILVDSQADTPEELQLEGGDAVYFSTVSPEKKFNGDSLCISENKSKSSVLAIADGAGGTPGGDKASGEMLEKIGSILETAQDPDITSAIWQGIESANELIRSKKTGARSTLSLVQIQGNRIRCYQVGDSRILVVSRQGNLCFRSLMHTEFGLAEAAGIESPSEVGIDDTGEVLNVMGDEVPQIDCSLSFELKKADTLLICSDGLSDNIEFDQLVSTIKSGSLKEAAQELLSQATTKMKDPKNPGKPDDLTFILYRRREE